MVGLALTVAAALTLNAVPAQSCPALQVRNPDGNYIIPGVQGDIPYSGDLALDAYVQPGTPSRPSIVVIHGGGWSSGSRIAHVGQILETVTSAGYHWFSVDYRLGGPARQEDSLADVRAALRFIRCRAGELGIDPDRLVLLGEDAGADLAARLAAERLPGVIGAILIGGLYDLKVVPRMPPVLVVHGGADSEVPVAQARRYCDDVVKADGRCRFMDVPGGGHRSENWWPSQWGYKGAMVEWLSAVAPAPPMPVQAHSGVVQKDIVYDAATGMKLDAFVPRADARGPGAIIVHGGGWEAGDKVTYVTPLFEPLARAGIAWFSIDYRLTPAVPHEDQLEDVRRAIRFVRAEHARFNIDPARIVLVGESASGQMVAQLAAEDASLAGVVSFYGVYDFLAMVTDASPRSLLVRLFRRTVLDEESRAVLRQYSPVFRAHKRMPPVLLVNGTGERLWAQAQAYAQRLKELGVRQEIIALEGAPHGMENWEGHPEWAGYKQRVVEWIRRVSPAGGR